MSGSRDSTPGIPPLELKDGQQEDTDQILLRIDSYVESIAASPKTSSGVYAQLIPQALQYIAPEGPGKSSHYFCNNGGEPHLRLHTCMLRVLSYKSGPEIKQWLDALAKCLLACSECFKGYLVAKEELTST